MKSTVHIFSAICLSLFGFVAFAQAQINIGGFTVTQTANAGAQVCTQDAKLCPDGVTYVGRTGPNCSFAACPVSPGGDIPPVDTDTCVAITNNLYLRSTDARTGGEVSLLQDFLSPKYFNQEPTGYFGNFTLRAVQAFQRDNGITPALGYVGPMTRAKIKSLTCGGVSEVLTINSVAPTQAKVGDTVVLSGPGLNNGGDYILFDGYRIETDGSKVLNRLAFVVPQYLSYTFNCIKEPCPDAPVRLVQPGSYSIQVVNNLGKSNTMYVQVVDGVVGNKDISISEVRPSAAKVGERVTIFGYGLFRSETKILFEGVSISGTPVYTKQAGNFDSALEFIVPRTISSCVGIVCTAVLPRIVTPGTYELAVENRFGRDSVKFEVLGSATDVLPTLSSLSPASGNIGSRVVISGKNINTGSEYVLFSGFRIGLERVDSDRVAFFVPGTLAQPCFSALSCPPGAVQIVTPGSYGVQVGNVNGVSNAGTFTVTDTTIVQPLAITTFEVRDISSANGSAMQLERRLFWNTTGAQYCVASGAWSGTKGVNGSESIGFMLQPLTYTITCYNDKGVSVTRNLTYPTQSVSQTPRISSVSPLTASLGAQVTLSGERLNTGSPRVIFGNGIITPDPIRASDGILVFTIPSSMSRYCAPNMERACTDDMISVTAGTYNVQVTNSFGLSNTVQVTVSASSQGTPVISSISPSQGGTGTAVTLSGSNLNAQTDFVWFGGIKFAPDRTTKALNIITFIVPGTLFQCDAKPGQECLAVWQPTPLGQYDVRVEKSSGAVSNAVKYQVTSNGSASTF